MQKSTFLLPPSSFNLSTKTLVRYCIASLSANNNTPSPQMEKFNFLRHDGGCRKLPPGFRFQPTEEELVFQYLARKTLSHPLPASVIPELVDVFTFNPWDLPGDSGQDRYFFSKEEMVGQCRGGRRAGRVTCHGYWKATGGPDRRVVWSKRIPVVGVRRTLVFHRAKRCGAVKTDWIMNVYCMALSGHIGRKSCQGSVRVGKWVLCHVFLNAGARISCSISTTNDSSSSTSSSLSSDVDSSEVSSSTSKN